MSEKGEYSCVQAPKSADTRPMERPAAFSAGDCLGILSATLGLSGLAFACSTASSLLSISECGVSYPDTPLWTSFAVFGFFFSTLGPATSAFFQRQRRSKTLKKLLEVCVAAWCLPLQGCSRAACFSWFLGCMARGHDDIHFTLPAV
jgi:hypothetical protein